MKWDKEAMVIVWGVEEGSMKTMTVTAGREEVLSMRGLDQRKRKWPRWLVEERGESGLTVESHASIRETSLAQTLKVNERR